MILFVADNHYGAHCGRNQYEAMGRPEAIEFHEDDWRGLEQPLAGRCKLLILNMIADTCQLPMPGEAAEREVRAYLEAGGNLLLLHGASAAFWHWDWWRPQVGWRWVRPNDPDGIAPSTHPKRPYRLDVCKARHPLCRQLSAIDLPTDEIYTNLEQTRPTLTLMQTTTDEGTFPQCYETTTDWGGRVIGYLPGHAPEVVAHPEMIANCHTLMNYLLEPIA